MKFLKWAGSKQGLLKQYEPLFPIGIEAYCEPFLGSGAVFFHLRDRIVDPDLISLGDLNPNLVYAYRDVRDFPHALITMLCKMEQEYKALDTVDKRKDYYASVRKVFNQINRTGRMSRASATWDYQSARFIFLNRTGFNGLWRVNSSGEFNVPHGNYKNPSICQMERLTKAHYALQGIRVEGGDYVRIAIRARAKNAQRPRRIFFYFDPPYIPVDQTSFTSYTADSFGPKQHATLAELARELTEDGHDIMVSNSDTELTRKLYEGFKIHEVRARRNINSDANGRGEVTELVITNY